MQSIFFGRDSKDRVVSIFDVKNGLACNCTCLDCGKPLIAHKGSKKSWHFQHQTFCKCATAEETSIHRLVKGVLSKLDFFSVPGVSYLVGNKVVSLKESEIFEIQSVVLEETIKKDNVYYRPDIVLTSKTGKTLYLEVYVSHKSTRRKVEAYRRMNCMALEIKFNDDDFNLCRCIEELELVVKKKLNSMSYTFTWLSHPALNDLVCLLEDKGVSFFNASGLTSVLCPSRGSVVSTKTCKECPYKIVVSSKEVRCRGNLSRSDLLRISPDVVFPPEKVNYAGKCSKCSSSNTELIDKGNNLGVIRVCHACNYSEYVSCPICDGRLAIKTNSNPIYESYLSKFIGCDDCSFTLTYLKPNGEFADEVQFTGDLDKIRSDNSRYLKDLMSYRRIRKGTGKM